MCLFMWKFRISDFKVMSNGLNFFFKRPIWDKILFSFREVREDLKFVSEEYFSKRFIFSEWLTKKFEFKEKRPTNMKRIWQLIFDKKWRVCEASLRTEIEQKHYKSLTRYFKRKAPFVSNVLESDLPEGAFFFT